MRKEYQPTCIQVNKFFCFTRELDASSFSCMKKYGERIKAARDYAKLTQPQLAEKLDGKITQQGISYLESGDAYGSEFTVQIANVCGVDSTWLATGEGDMVNTDLTNAHLLMQKMSEYDRKVWLKMGNSLTKPAEGTNGKQ